ncbi:hypothetical protein D3P06_12065 [Paracoccus aestuarii]|uniref:Uncharacterized protein n=1 Tax=Paracoccus aestuarii TaxID=453842 RepID=A0A418ZUX1_9RHOB|nr:hypothetical protein [Paracoccus aestuarii]RJL01823.1 hypothetical protein D3P06_12065 [Paracoccus aestuarii]WCQ98373.1 hypothetical protein JHW48_10610 [Paracoccus aestuarii]
MRGWMILAALTVAGCGEHRGWNPNYQFGNDRYGQYLAAREAALISGERPASTIAIARPILAPTPARIAGQDPVPVPATMGVRVAAP